MSPTNGRKKLIGKSSGICSNLIVPHAMWCCLVKILQRLGFQRYAGEYLIYGQNRLVYASRVIKVIPVYRAEMTTDRNAMVICIAWILIPPMRK